MIKKYGLGLFFYVIALLTYFVTRDAYILGNFIYIGTVIIIGLKIYYRPGIKYKNIARSFIQFGVGMYMLVVITLILRENVQLEAFLINILAILGGNIAAFTTASVMHYFVAKTIGVIAIGRNWCGWACWYPAIFELFPYRKSKGRHRKLQIIPYITLCITILLAVSIFFNSNLREKYNIHVIGITLISAAVYYIIGVILIFVTKDNRAICKYFCPVPIIQKIFMPISLFYIKTNINKCIDCKKCEKQCGMDINITKYIANNQNVTAPSCIQCRKCVESCKMGALTIGFGLKKGKSKEYINYYKE